MYFFSAVTVCADRSMSTGYNEYKEYPSSLLILASVLLEGQIQFLCSSCQNSGSEASFTHFSRHKKSEFECAHQTRPREPHGAPHFSFTHAKISNQTDQSLSLPSSPATRLLDLKCHRVQSLGCG